MTDAPLPSFLADAPVDEDLFEASFDAATKAGVDLAGLIDLDPEKLPAGVDASVVRPLATEAHAEYAARRLSEIASLRAGVAEQAAEWRSRIDGWEAERIAPLTRRMAYFERLLERYGLEHRAKDPKHNKTLLLPSARVATTASNVGGVVTVVDDAAVVAWAESTLTGDDFDAVVKVTSKPLVGELRKRVKIVRAEDGTPTVIDAGGQVVPGCAVTEESVSVKVTPL